MERVLLCVLLCAHVGRVLSIEPAEWYCTRTARSRLRRTVVLY
jgi:hypothetical protein